MQVILINLRPVIIVSSTEIFKTMQSFLLTNHNIPMPELEPHCCKSCHKVHVQFSRGVIVLSNSSNINKAHDILITKQTTNTKCVLCVFSDLSGEPPPVRPESRPPQQVPQKTLRDLHRVAPTRAR